MPRKPKVDWMSLLISDHARKMFQKRWEIDEREFERMLCWRIRVNKKNAKLITKLLEENGSISIKQGTRGRMLKAKKGAKWKL